MKFLNSKKQGDAGLGSAINYFTSRGETVCLPLTDSQEFDLVVDRKGLKKIQVKTTTYKVRKCFVVALRTCGGNRSGKGTTKKLDKKRVAFLYILTGNGDKYLIPTKKIQAESHLTLSSKYEKFKV